MTIVIKATGGATTVTRPRLPCFLNGAGRGRTVSCFLKLNLSYAKSRILRKGLDNVIVISGAMYPQLEEVLVPGAQLLEKGGVAEVTFDIPEDSLGLRLDAK